MIKNFKPKPVWLAGMVALGICLLLLPRLLPKPTDREPLAAQNEQNNVFVPPILPESSAERELEKRLEEIFALVHGAGRVRVMVSPMNAGERVYAKNATTSTIQTNEKDAQGGVRDHNQHQNQEQIVIIGDRPLVIREVLPQVTGVVIIAEGGDCAFVRDALTRAARSILNVEAHRIQVLQMAS
jgi:stage III sporulation protein AG